MKKIYSFLFLIAFVLNASAQDKTIDSLKKLVTSQRQDTTSVNRYILIASSYYNTDLDSCYVYAKKAFELANKINWPKGLGTSQVRMSWYFYAKGNYPKALSLFLSSLEIFEKIKDTSNIMSCLSYIGTLYSTEEDYQRSVIYFKEALKLARLVDDKQSTIIFTFLLGNDYVRLKMADSALVYYQENYQLSNSFTINQEGNISYALLGLGRVHLLMNNTDLALSFLRKSLPNAIKVNYSPLLESVYYTFSDVFNKMGMRDSSLVYSEKALPYALKWSDKRFLIDEYKQLAKLYKGHNNDSAIKYYALLSDLRDSLFTAQKKKEMSSLTLNEEERQKEIAGTELKAKEEHKLNLQYAAIAIALITFIILFFLLSHSIIVKTKFIEFFGVLGLLAVFEFINLFIHPYLSHATNDSPVLMLAVLIAIGALLIPLHHKLEKWITKIMVEKNKKIRLAAAKKTIQQLEGEQTN